MNGVSGDVVQMLSFLAASYEGITKFIAQTRNRLHSMNPDALVDENEIIKDAEKTKGKISRRLEKELEFFPVWNQWLKGVPGIGPAIASKLILLFNYRQVPVCQVCGTPVEKKQAKEDSNERGTYFCPSCQKSIKGEGNLVFRIEQKDFATISKWWAYMGRHNVEGNMPKRKKGVVSNWSTEGRTVGFLIGESFIKQVKDHLYRQVYDVRRAKADKDHPEASKLHKMRMAKNETVKLFLAHFWTVSRTLDGKPVSEPYAMTILGHTNYVAPFYFCQAPSETNADGANHVSSETKKQIMNHERDETTHLVVSNGMPETNFVSAPRRRGRPRKVELEARA